MRRLSLILLVACLVASVPTWAATIRVAETGEDGFSENTDEQTLPSTAQFGAFYLGTYTVSAVPYNLDGAWIFRSTGIPQGATVNSCTITLQINTADIQAGTPEGTWYGFAVDSPTDFNAADAHRVSDHHTRTTANVPDVIAGGTTTYTSPSLVSVCQEIVNRAGYTGDLGITWRNTGVTADEYWPWLDYTDNSSQAALLTYTYTAGGGPSMQFLKRRISP